MEKWYYSTPISTMKESFKPQPLEFLKDRIAYHKRKNEFSGFVDASFKGGTIDRPLLDPIRKPTTPEQFDLSILKSSRVKDYDVKYENL